MIVLTGVLGDPRRAIVVALRPRHPIGWLFTAVGLLWTAGLTATAAADAPGPGRAADASVSWWSEWFWIAGVRLDDRELLRDPDRPRAVARVAARSSRVFAVAVGDADRARGARGRAAGERHRADRRQPDRDRRARRRRGAARRWRCSASLLFGGAVAAAASADRALPARGRGGAPAAEAGRAGRSGRRRLRAARRRLRTGPPLRVVLLGRRACSPCRSRSRSRSCATGSSTSTG